MTFQLDPVMPPLAERSCAKAHALLDELGIPSNVADYGCTDDQLIDRIAMLTARHQDELSRRDAALSRFESRVNTLIDLLQGQVEK